MVIKNYRPMETVDDKLEQFADYKQLLLSGHVALTGHDVDYMHTALQQNFPTNRLYANGMTGAQIIDEFKLHNFSVTQLPDKKYFAPSRQTKQQ
jgi:hypothetical protein